MSVYRIWLHPQVYREINASFDWYEKQAARLGWDFLTEIESAIESIQEMPQTWPVYYHFNHVHRFLLHRFPFGLIYRLKGNEIQILASAHTHRKPGYWKKRF